MEKASPQLGRITETEWEELWEKLMLYTWGRYKWVHDKTGLDLDELAEKAIHATLAGIRKWPPEDHVTGEPKHNVTLFYFLCRTVDSYVSHEWKAAAKKVAIDETSEAKDLRVVSLEQLFVEGRGESPYLISVLGADAQAIDNEFKRRLSEYIGDDDRLKEILILLLDGMKPAEIAHQLDISVEQMYAAQKRLRRRVENFLQEMNDNG